MGVLVGLASGGVELGVCVLVGDAVILGVGEFDGVFVFVGVIVGVDVEVGVGVTGQQVEPLTPQEPGTYPVPPLMNPFISIPFTVPH